MKRLADLPRCPKCKSADITACGHELWKYECLACGNKMTEMPPPIRDLQNNALAPAAPAAAEPRRCETTGTMRYHNPDCKCPTYEGNLGPCAAHEEGANGRCVYCDHELSCKPLAEPVPQSDPDAKRGLFDNKYRVERVDPTGKHQHCFYFVLDTTHDKFWIPAMTAYANACESEYPLLARDIRERLLAAPSPAETSQASAGRAVWMVTWDEMPDWGFEGLFETQQVAEDFAKQADKDARADHAFRVMEVPVLAALATPAPQEPLK